jgi:glycosyltransferase involved in cell wall biosynthesis
MTLAVPIVAPDSPQLRETLPPAGHGLLFDPQREGSLVSALERALDLSEPDLLSLRQQCWRRARHLSPANISRRLGELFDSLLADPVGNPRKAGFPAFRISPASRAVSVR